MLLRAQAQHERQEQVLRADVGDGDVVGDRLQAAQHAGVGELKFQDRCQVGDAGERAGIDLRQADLLAAPQGGGDLEVVMVCRQGVKGQHGRPAGRVVGDGPDRDVAGGVAG